MRSIPCTVFATLLLAVLVPASRAQTSGAQDSPATDKPSEERTMSHHVRGTFDVKMTPQPPADGEPASIGRMVLDKTYQGPLEATGQGQMLAHRTDVEGSAGYVALEQVEGTLDGKKGTFVLQHSGLMDRGRPSLTLVVVPDSGTGDLAGLQGTMDIIIEDGQHYYEFDYTVGGGEGSED